MISLPFRCRLQLIPLVALLLCAISPGLEGATVLVSGSSLVRTVAITFDDGPHDKLTPTLLDVLDTLGVKASFFLVGSMAEKKPDLVREIRSGGHTVANHSQTHRSCLVLSAEELEDEIRKCSAVLESVTSVPVRFFRPPGGKFDRKTVERVRKNGLKMVLWDINSRDYTGVSPSSIANRAVRRAVPGSIGSEGNHRRSPGDCRPAQKKRVRIRDAGRNVFRLHGIRSIPPAGSGRSVPYHVREMSSWGSFWLFQQEGRLHRGREAMA